MIVLTHTSKTMRGSDKSDRPLRQPVLIDKAIKLDIELKKLSIPKIQTLMKVSPKLAETTGTLISGWTHLPGHQRIAIDSFLGDIYSGMQVHTWSDEDMLYADKHLLILSGLYGILRPLDGIMPYRYEMGYKYPSSKHKNLYSYWGDKIANVIPPNEEIVNLTAVEYSKAVLPYLNQTSCVTPIFLTHSDRNDKPEFVTVHTKIARGAFVRWIIKERIDQVGDLNKFNDLGYVYHPETSTAIAPVFVCKTFGGLGLSVRESVR